MATNQMRAVLDSLLERGDVTKPYIRNGRRRKIFRFFTIDSASQFQE